MSETEFNVVRSVGFVLAVAIAAGLQRWRPHARMRRPWRSNVGLWAINLVVIGVVCGGCACAVARWAAAADVGLLNAISAPTWLGVPVTVLVLDFVSYLWHRANHRVRWLWRFHQVHHSDAAFTVSTGVRFHPGELLLSLPVRLAAVTALGPSPLAVVAFEVVFTIANLVEHGNIDLPLAIERRIGRVWITPALHRRHHSRRRSELNSNFGTLFAWWDRLLGTYAGSSSDERIETGLADLPETPRIGRALILPLRFYAPRA
ncbi:MAG TPA: sterol desaturase family protein [Candidatus Dormibacteraeota bacterium]|nr:sterol desaturase family protein [Candidatus Dormibacteraeota bacterium]